MANEKTEDEHVDPAYSYIDAKVKPLEPLKARFIKLSNRLEDLEVLKLPEQIYSLGDEVKDIKTQLNIVSREMATFEMEFLQYHMLNMIENKKLTPTVRSRLREYIASEYATSDERAKTVAPFEVLKDFRKKCVDCSNKYNLHAFH